MYHGGAITRDSKLELSKEASHHLMTVLRARAGDSIVVFNGDGNEYHATLHGDTERPNRRCAVLEVMDSQVGIAESPVHITLIQCVSRPERMDICLRQSVELGVTHIQPLYSRHSIKVKDEAKAAKKQEHWQSIILSACEQSARNAIPTLGHAENYEQWFAASKASEGQSESAVQAATLVLSPTATQSLSQQADALAKAAKAIVNPQPIEISKPTQGVRVAIIIGPESGLDGDEIQTAIACGAVPVNIGKRILRTETAGPACIAILQSILGDL